MKNLFKNIFAGTTISYFILGILNLIRYVIFHYYCNIPNIIRIVQTRTIDEYTNLYELASQYYYYGYMENSIKIEIYLLLFSILIGIIYGYIKSKKK